MNKIFLYLSLFALVSFSFVYGGIEKYFKPASNKSEIHQIRNIDFIYMINLDQRPEKFEKCIKQLHPYGIYPYRFSAVNGWELSLETINDVGVKFSPGMDGGFWATSFLTPDFDSYHEPIQQYGQTYFCHCIARGTIGICLSHLSVLQDAYDSGYETIWVMEDDIEVVRDPTIISDLIDSLDHRMGRKGWDILFTDRDIRDAQGAYVPCFDGARRPNFHLNHPSVYSRRTDIDSNFRSIGARFGAHSMIIRRSGMKKILDFIKTHQIYHPYDMDFYLPPGIRLITVLDDVVTNQSRAISDNGSPFYLDKK